MEGCVLNVAIRRVEAFQFLAFRVRLAEFGGEVYFRVVACEAEGRVADDVALKDVGHLSPLSHACSKSEDAEHLVGLLVLQHVDAVGKAHCRLSVGEDVSSGDIVLLAEVSVVASVEDDHSRVGVDAVNVVEHDAGLQVLQRVSLRLFGVVPSCHPCGVDAISACLLRVELGRFLSSCHHASHPVAVVVFHGVDMTAEVFGVG